MIDAAMVGRQMQQLYQTFRSCSQRATLEFEICNHLPRYSIGRHWCRSLISTAEEKFTTRKHVGLLQPASAPASRVACKNNMKSSQQDKHKTWRWIATCERLCAVSKRASCYGRRNAAMTTRRGGKDLASCTVGGGWVVGDEVPWRRSCVAVPAENSKRQRVQH